MSIADNIMMATVIDPPQTVVEEPTSECVIPDVIDDAGLLWSHIRIPVGEITDPRTRVALAATETVLPESYRTDVLVAAGVPAKIAAERGAEWEHAQHAMTAHVAYEPLIYITAAHRITNAALDKLLSKKRAPKAAVAANKPSPRPKVGADV